jgi:hypothetical protein
MTLMDGVTVHVVPKAGATLPSAPDKLRLNGQEGTLAQPDARGIRIGSLPKEGVLLAGGQTETWVLAQGTAAEPSTALTAAHVDDVVLQVTYKVS